MDNLDQILANVNQVSEKIAGMENGAAEATKSIAALTEKQEAMQRELAALQQQNAAQGAEKTEAAKSYGERFVTSAGYKAFKNDMATAAQASALNSQQLRKLPRPATQ